MRSACVGIPDLAVCKAVPGTLSGGRAARAGVGVGTAVAHHRGMATLLMLILVVGYAWSVWSLKRQEHFDERAPRKPRLRLTFLNRLHAPARFSSSHGRPS
jgi:hypothetical protein